MDLSQEKMIEDWFVKNYPYKPGAPGNVSHINGEAVVRASRELNISQSDILKELRNIDEFELLDRVGIDPEEIVEADKILLWNHPWILSRINPFHEEMRLYISIYGDESSTLEAVAEGFSVPLETVKKIADTQRRYEAAGHPGKPITSDWEERIALLKRDPSHFDGPGPGRGLKSSGPSVNTIIFVVGLILVLSLTAYCSSQERPSNACDLMGGRTSPGGALCMFE